MEMKQVPDATRRKSNYRVYVVGGVGIVVILGLLIGVIVLAVRLDDEDAETGGSPTPVPAVSQPSVLAYFNLTDGLNVRWYPRANTRADMNAATAGQYQIIEAAVYYPDIEGGEFTLSEWLDLVLQTKSGIKLNVNTSKAAVDTLTVLRNKHFYRPVFLSVPLLSSAVNLKQLAVDLDSVADNLNVIISVDLSGECCDDPIGYGTMEHVYNQVNGLNVNLNIEVRPEMVSASWEEIKWLLTAMEKATLTVSESSNSSVSESINYEMLMARNDIDENKIFYNLNGTNLDDFLELASTAGSPLHYFNIHPRDASKIIWSHNTDTWTQLNNATQGDTMMVEGDIMLEGQGTANQTNVTVMAHTVGDDNNMTFTQWLDEIIKVDKGMKLDFKSLEAVKPALAIVNSKRDQIKGPIWANADILKGNGNDVTMTPSIFLNDIKSFPAVTLSLGWTTLGRNGTNATYTMDMVKEMHEICKTLPQPVTMPVRAEMLRDSWHVFDWLLDQSRGYTLTVWTSPTDTVHRGDMEYVKQQAEHSRIYFDLPQDLKPIF